MTNHSSSTNARKAMYFEASKRCRELIDLLTKVEGMCERGMRDTIDPMQEHTDRTMHGMINRVLVSSERFLFVALRACTGALEVPSNGEIKAETDQPDATGRGGGETADPGRRRPKRNSGVDF